MISKKSTSIPDLILDIQLGKLDLPKNVDRIKFIEYLKDLHEVERYAIEYSDRILTKRQAWAITASTLVMAFCAVAMLIIELCV